LTLSSPEKLTQPDTTMGTIFCCRVKFRKLFEISNPATESCDEDKTKGLLLSTTTVLILKLPFVKISVVLYSKLLPANTHVPASFQRIRAGALPAQVYIPLQTGGMGANIVAMSDVILTPVAFKMRSFIGHGQRGVVVI